MLVYYDSFTTSTEPAERAATALGWTVTATNNGTTFASNYDAGGWNVIVIDIPGSSIPTDVRSRVLTAISAGLKVIFSWWSLNTDAHLRSCLMGRSESIPLVDGELQLGEFGEIYFVDFDSVRQRERVMQVQIVGE